MSDVSCCWGAPPAVASGVAQCALQSCRYNAGCCMVSCSMQPGPVLTGGHMTNEPVAGGQLRLTRKLAEEGGEALM